MKDFKVLATERYSVRKFDTRQVEQEKVDMLLAVARLAPTAHNYQPQRLLVLNTEDSLKKLKVTSMHRWQLSFVTIIR
jgi:nitroreductase